MAGPVNKAILIGNLGRDPEIRRTQDGRPIANLRIATSDTWRDKATGERRSCSAKSSLYGVNFMSLIRVDIGSSLDSFL